MASDYQGKKCFHFGFKYALNGLMYAIKKERNVKIHLLATAVVFILGIWTKLSFIEWAVLSLTCGTVIGMEVMNTAVETALNYLEPNKRIAVGLAKDLAAGAVLVTAIFAIIIGCCIFLPHWIN
ncbi:diacylglycerol kinase (ATP) [Gracilibacillus ureilyticus]|uniref:Diacylglycerol kinase (ATP) n=1 Tax=Gracilibacillus ureilyticus TaxID=531814 RepID=A0A1H9M2W1_9BACI|nr:diacylglycerol kinase family protein [Gracilibacillus ureilyticus]SER17807.1 diacylglycerol kinase (ATP) [Gracilibacillus ureilyticus]